MQQIFSLYISCYSVYKTIFYIALSVNGLFSSPQRDCFQIHPTLSRLLVLIKSANFQTFFKSGIGLLYCPNGSPMT